MYRGVVRDIGEEVAIKVIDLDMFNTNWDEIRKEIMLMANLNHPNVVKLKTAFVDGQDLWLVMSLATSGSAAAVMKELHATNGLKDEILIATILKEVLQALAYFHKHGSIHRDVKAGNILISGQGDVQLAGEKRTTKSNRFELDIAIIIVAMILILVVVRLFFLVQILVLPVP